MPEFEPIDPIDPDNPGLDPDNPGPYIVDGTSGDNDKFEPGIDDLNEPLKVRLGDYLSKNTTHGHNNGYTPTHGNAYTVPLGSNEFTFTGEDGRPVEIVTAGGQVDPQHAFSPLGDELDQIPSRGNTFGGLESGGRTLGELLSRGGASDNAPYTGNTLLKDAVISGGMRKHGEAEADDIIEPKSVPVSDLISQALLNNRWNPRSGQTPFDPEGDRANDQVAPGVGELGSTVALNEPIATLQTQMGAYTPGDENASNQITFDQLRRVGLSMMLRAAGEPGSNNVDPLSPSASATLAPGSSQLGIPRALAGLGVSDAYGAPGNQDNGGAEGVRPHVNAGLKVGNPSLDGLVPFSFGSFNHFLEPFQKDVVASRALAGALALTLALASKPVQGILAALMEPVTNAEALSRIIPIGAAAISSKTPFGIDLGQITAEINKQGMGPLLHKGRSSRRNIVFSPAVWEFLGFVVPDNQAGIIGPASNARYRNGDGDSPGKLGDKYSSYFFTVERGIATLFGVVNVAQSPGFYITVAREIVRDVIIAGHRMAKRIERSQTGGVSAGSAINDVSETIMEMIDTKMTKFVNVLATIGNASLKASPTATLSDVMGSGFSRGLVVRNEDGATKNDKGSISFIDNLPSEYSMSGKYSKNGAGRGAGYRAGNALSMLIMPESFENAAGGMLELFTAAIENRQELMDLKVEEMIAAGKTEPQARLDAQRYMTGNFGIVGISAPNIAYEKLQEREAAGTDTSKSNFRVQPKITPKEREDIEAELEAEYMPFYFHDLRTNEIVSFQAFLQQLTDNYSVSHQKTSAYGRIDDIMVYQKTTRAISVGFTIACTNRADFDIMYAKINKLLTLIYPQWSPGRQIINTEGDQKIIAPFSQIPTSSPVIRLRIGDIIRRNGSKFNLLRLFGMGTDNFLMPGFTDAGPATATRTAGGQATNAAFKNKAFGKLVNEDENPVLKSFKAVGGKGLAGVITSMNFDWLGSNTWEVSRYGSRAPKLCKVTIAFSPIHDIAPGIDADGMNRAPLYPVGNAMQSLSGQAADSDGRAKFNDMKKDVNEVVNKMISKTNINDYT